jgi:hypothetical protein
MRWIPKIVHALIAGVALYFILFWGCDAVRALTSPGFGLDDPARAQGVLALGRLLSLDHGDLVRVAAFLAAFKLTAVAVFALHLISRARAEPSAPFDHDLLEGALLLVVILTALMTAPAVIENDRALMRHGATDLLLAAVAALLSVTERFVVATQGQAAYPAARGRATKRPSSWLWR